MVQKEAGGWIWPCVAAARREKIAGSEMDGDEKTNVHRRCGKPFASPHQIPLQFPRNGFSAVPAPGEESERRAMYTSCCTIGGSYKPSSNKPSARLIWFPD